ncbi:MAG TPA: glycoside hydrolase family 27 protein, partial [Bryobacteraceae bacterium]|nr:glycoside hydrolase family 27 protein [Bryobacteraceae bacterium]
MTKTIFLTLLTLAVPAAHAADLTGKWVVKTANGEIDYYLISHGDTFTGYIAGEPPQPISDGRVTGGEIAFTVTRQVRNNEVKVNYTGSITPEGLSIQPPVAGGRGGRGASFGFGEPPTQPAAAPPPAMELAKRVSTAMPPPMPPLPTKVSLPPPAKPVPYNGLAKTPPMGWNSWNKFQRGVNDQVVREIADAMVKNGMRDAGYVYVNIDDTWEGTRDANGNIQSNEKFPNMKALADYVHSQGLKLGIYSSPGPKTCAGFEGSYQHEEQDAKTWASWGIDYLKYDWCSAAQVYDSSSEPGAYAKMGEALLHSGRAIVFSLCQYGQVNVGEWGASA